MSDAINQAREKYQSAFDALENKKADRKTLEARVTKREDEKIPALEAKLKEAEAAKFRTLDDYAAGRATEAELKQARASVRDAEDQLEEAREILHALQRREREDINIILDNQLVQRTLNDYCNAVAFSVMDEFLNDRRLKAAIRDAYVAWGYTGSGDNFHIFLDEIFKAFKPTDDEAMKSIDGFERKYINPITGSKKAA